MIGTSLKQQLTENIGPGEEVRFFSGPMGLTIHRIHVDKHMKVCVNRIQLQVMREELVDEWLGEELWNMAVKLRSAPPEGSK